jgi:hypothetical protein
MLYVKEELSERQINLFRMLKNKVIDSIELEWYELYLIKSENEDMNNFYNGVIYALGLQKVGRDFTDYGQQFETIPFEHLPKSIMPKLIDKIKEWINKYGKIIINSFNVKKVNQYKKLFDMFKINYTEIAKEFGDREIKYLVIG